MSKRSRMNNFSHSVAECVWDMVTVSRHRIAETNLTADLSTLIHHHSPIYKENNTHWWNAVYEFWLSVLLE